MEESSFGEGTTGDIFSGFISTDATGEWEIATEALMNPGLNLWTLRTMTINLMPALTEPNLRCDLNPAMAQHTRNTSRFIIYVDVGAGGSDRQVTPATLESMISQK